MDLSFNYDVAGPSFGQYNPFTNEITINLFEIFYSLSNGAYGIDPIFCETLEEFHETLSLWIMDTINHETIHRVLGRFAHDKNECKGLSYLYDSVSVIVESGIKIFKRG